MSKENLINSVIKNDSPDITLNLLSEFTLDYLKYTDKEDLFIHSTKKLFEITNASYVIFSRYYNKNKRLKIESVYGNETTLSQVSRLFSFNPYQSEIHIKTDLKNLSHRNLTPFKNKTFSLYNKNITKSKLKKVLELTKTQEKYVIGITYKEEFIGCMFFFYKKKINDLECKLIEKLIHLIPLFNQLKEKEDSFITDNKTFRKIISELPDSIAITDIKTGKLVSFNKEMLKLAKADPTYLKNKNTFELGIWGNENERNIYLQKLKTEGHVKNHENSIVDCQGNKRCVLLSSIIIEFNNGKKILSTIKDITEIRYTQSLKKVLYNITKEANKSGSLKSLLEKIHAELGIILDVENFYIAIYHEEENKYSFPYHFDKYEEIDEEELIELKGTLTDYVRKSGKALYVNEDIEKELNNKEKVVLYGEPSPVWLGAPLLNTQNKVIGIAALQNYTNENTYTEKDLEILEFVASHIGAIIEKKNTENLIQKNENKLRSFVELSQVGICSIRPNQKINIKSSLDNQLNEILKGQFTECNQAYANMYGIEKNEVIKQKVKQVFTDYDNHQNLIHKFLENNYKISGEIIGINNKLTNNSSFLSCSIVGRVDDDFLTEIWMTQVDIKERIEAEHKLSHAMKKAEESDRLKLAFLSNMSHEIRTPMNAIMGFSSFLTEPNISKDEKKDFVQKIIKNGENLLSIINDILDVSKLETDVLTIENKNFSVKMLLDELYDKFNKHKKDVDKDDIKLIFNKPHNYSSLNIYSDPYRINQILSNLLNNAFKYTEKGYVKFGFEYSGESELVFFVEDSGIGIPIDKSDIIFDHFRQVDDTHTREYGGTGIGLTIAKKLAEKLNGNLWVSSEESKGSTFYLEIPMELKNLKIEDIGKIDVNSNTNLNDTTVLIAEDVDSNYFLINRILQNTGANTIRANNGREAIKMYHNYKNIDLILMDVRMPIMDGIQATKAIKSLNPHIPIVALTAYATVEDQTKLLLEGFDDYLSKPVNFQKLLETIYKYCKIKIAK